ncbi:MAG: hypothetical protein RI956_416 [Pseudomonadota bacterium]|jgi:hypothetical protein
MKKIIPVIFFSGYAYFSLSHALPNQPLQDTAEKISNYINLADFNKNKKSIYLINPAYTSKTLGNRVFSEIVTDESNLKMPKRVLMQQKQDVLESNSNLVKVLIPLSKVKNKTVTLLNPLLKSGQNKFTIGLPIINSISDTQISKDGSVIYIDRQGITDMVVQSFEDSARVLTVLNNINSPVEYIYTVNIPVGGQILKMPNGAIVIFDKSTNLVGGFAPPWAVDAEGKKIPTHYEIRGNTVVQIINHINAAIKYPVVADPWFGSNLIDRATWAPVDSNNGFIILNVYPTYWARYLGIVAYSGVISHPIIGGAAGVIATKKIGIAGWNELYSKNPTGILPD